MTTRIPSQPLRLAPPPDRYDQQDQANLRRSITDAIKAIGTKPDVALPWFDVTDFGTSVGQGYDDTTAIAAAVTEATGTGGGELFFPGGKTYTMEDANVAVPRTLNVRGDGSMASTLLSASGKQLQIGGSGGGWGQSVSGLLFDGVTLLYGKTITDFANGCSTVRCEFQNSTTGIVYRYNSFLNTIDDCRFHDLTNGVQFDLATAGTTSGAKQVISNSAIFNCAVGVLYNGGPGGFDLFVTNTDIEHMTQAGIKTVGATEDSIFLNNIHFELYDAAAYFIINDGAHIFLDGFWALSGSEKAWFSNASGEIYVRRGRATWSNNKFAKITGGTIVVDPEHIFCPARWWGDGTIPMVTGDSSGGTIVNGRHAYVGQTNKTFATITDSVPGPIIAATIQARDANERVFEFDVACSADVGANNTLRIDLTNGHSVVRCDLLFPLAIGGAHLRVTHTPGGAFSVAGTWSPSVADHAQWMSVTTTDTSTLADTRALTFETINGGAGTKATMTISNFSEVIAGPRQVAL